MKNIVFVVAHPDDAANGVGGTALLLRDKYKLHVLCATRGEKGLPGILTEKETAAIREKEEKKSSGIMMGAKVTFLDRIDREVFADKITSEKVAEILKRLKPVAIFTIWPIDSHPDHSAVSELTKKAIFLSEIKCELIFFEARLGGQTTQFNPDIFVDISKVIEEKMALIRVHVCQNPQDSMAQASLRQSSARGMQNNVAYAEGFKTVWPLGIKRKSSILLEV